VPVSAAGSLASVTATTEDRTVRPITEAEHAGFIAGGHAASFLQTPAWGRVKTEWRHESLGWFVGAAGDGASERLVGVGLVLYRAIPRTRRVFAYLPEGPVLDWTAAGNGSDERGLSGWLDPMIDYLQARKAFLVRMGPPVVTRTWSGPHLKAALADPSVTSFDQLTEDSRSTVGSSIVVQLVAAGWIPPPSGSGFVGGQPRYVFRLPLAGRSEADVFAGMNQLWRRNIRKAEKAGVTVTVGSATDLADFHRVYLETTVRDGFAPRALSYFQTMYRELSGEDPGRITLYLAHHEGDLIAATLAVRVNAHTWYSYGASTTAKRDFRGSNAVQWKMIRDAISAGCDVYDLRGITATLDENESHAGLIRFKLGTGGEAAEYAGEWDLPLNRLLSTAFTAYMRRRSG
jgi:lipid II:glycine glycyltransferase (peptidoglycan interpeptide bridge formation enzyme)